MFTLPPQSHAAWTAGVTCVHVLAVASTIYRLVHRFRTRRTWWDDYLVILPLIFDMTLCITFWFRNPQPYVPGQPLNIQVLNSYWLTGFVFITIIWSTRTVLALSLVRIFTIGRARRWTIALTIAMGIAWASAIIITTATCKQTNGFLRVNTKKDCILANGVAVKSIYLATVDFTGDFLLVVFPLILFWRVRLPQSERRLILTVFCASVFTLLAVVSYISLTLNPHISLGKDGATIGAGLSQIESAVSLLICNLAIVTTCLYQTICDKRDSPTIRAAKARTRAASHADGCSCTITVQNSKTVSPIEISILAETAQGTDKSQLTPHESVTTFEKQKSIEAQV